MSLQPEHLLPSDEIVRLLRQYKAEPGWANRRTSLKAIAALCGYGRDLIIKVRAGTRPVSERLQAAISPVLRDIEAGRIVYHSKREGGKWPEERIEYRQPPMPLPLPQPRVIPASDYNEWASCRSCGFSRFSRFVADKSYYACVNCVSDTDRKMLGAKSA